MSERPNEQRGERPVEAREHRLCPACGEYGVEYPVAGTGARCVACGTPFPYVEACVYCGQAVFLTAPWDKDRQGPPQHRECYPGELQSF